MDNQKVNLTTLLEDKNSHRLMLQATLAPVFGDRFQPAGFPEIGHVIYRAPRPENRVENVCIMDSPASMANHLESLCHETPWTLELCEDLKGLPYVKCVTDDGANDTPERLVVTSLSEGHRLASSYFLSDKAKVVENERATSETLINRLRSSFAMPDLASRTHPLPEDWWRVFRTIYRYDPNSLVHGILFPSLGIKIPRVLTAHHEAFGASRVAYSGVKFDKIGKTSSGQPIFAVDEEIANEIKATFVVDLALIRSFGRTTRENGADRTFGLSEPQKKFILTFCIWKIWRLLSAPFRFRSNCDLRLAGLEQLNTDGTPMDPSLRIEDLSVDIRTAIENADFDDAGKRITKVYWPSAELFKRASDEGANASVATETDEPDNGDTQEDT